MEGWLSEIYKRKWLSIVIILGLCFVLYFLNIGRWDLWNPDEPRYAQISREMVNRGNWILMHLNGKVYGDKPPLFFWLIALSSFVWGGFTSFSVRFPSALFGTLTVLITFFMGKKLFNSRTGFLSGLILATFFEFAYLSTRANIDATLTFFITLSLFCFLHWYKSSKQERDKRGPFIYGFYISMVFATLAKGPVGFIIPLLVSLIYFIVEKDWSGIKEMKLLPGMLLYMALVMCWYLPAVLIGGKAFLQETLFKHTVDAYAKGWTHVRPIYYYLLNFPFDFLPWFLFLPGALISVLPQRKKEFQKDFLFILVWFISVFLFFSFSKGKRSIYLLPLYPAATILVGRFWDSYILDSDRHSVREIFILLPIYLFIFSFFFMGIALYCIPAFANLNIDPSASKFLISIIKVARIGANYLSYVPRESIFPFILLLLISGIILTLSYYYKYKSMIFIILVTTFLIGFFYVTRSIFPLVNPYKSARFISQEITSGINPGEKVAIYGDFGVAPYNYYTGIVPIIEIENKEDLVLFLRSKERVFCLLKFRDFVNLQNKIEGLKVKFISRRVVGGDDIVLISNR